MIISVVNAVVLWVITDTIESYFLRKYVTVASP